MMSDLIHNAERLFEERLLQVAKSAALIVESGAAVIFAADKSGDVERLAQFGQEFETLTSLDYVSILNGVKEATDGFIVVSDAVVSANKPPLACLPTWRGKASRFALFIAIHDSHGRQIGILATADLKPKSGVSAAKTYVLLSLAGQVADAISLRAMRLVADHSSQGTERLRLLESVVVHAKDSILITEAEPIDLPGPLIVYCNDAFTDTTGYSREEVLGKTPRILQGVDTDPQSRAQIRAALSQWKPIEIEIINYRKDNTPFWVELSIAPVADERGWYTHWVSVQRDVTERKLAIEVQTRVRVAESNNASLQTLTNELRLALNAAEAANIAKSQFLANMSHEIRTPLNGVMGMTQALWLDELTSSQRDRVSIIRESSRSLLTVLNDVLDLSKIEAGKMEIDEADFDLETLAHGVCSAFTEQVESVGVAFSLVVEEQAKGVWTGDPVRLKQVLYNLISNAAKFTADGSVRVSMGITEDSFLHITVADTGIGIANEKLVGLFSKFYQADSSTTRRFGGTGLGLSICRQLCELMGGTIDVQTQIGVGSTFTVILPLRHAPLERTAALSDGAPVGADAELSNRIARIRILVAEDNAVNQIVISTLLAAFNIAPVVVDNGRQALARWQTEAFDLVLMDVQMPELDGISATRSIRALEALHGLAPTPIVAVSANAMTHQIQDYLEAGMNGHIAKPIDIAVLADTLETYASLLDPAAGAGRFRQVGQDNLD